MRQRAGQPHRRQEGAFQNVHVVGRDIDVVGRSQHRRIGAQPIRQGRIQRLRQHGIDRSGGAQGLGTMADDLLIGGNSRIERRHRSIILRLARGQAVLGLGDVGLGALAHLQPVIGGIELLLEEVDVLLLQIEVRLGLHEVHEGRHAGQQRALLGRAQGLASSENRRFRHLHAVLGAEAREDRLLDGNRIGPRMKRGRAGRDDTGLNAARNRRLVAAKCLRHAFVGGAQGCARRIQRRIIGISRSQGLKEGLCARRRQTERNTGDNRSYRDPRTQVPHR